MAMHDPRHLTFLLFPPTPPVVRSFFSEFTCDHFMAGFVYGSVSTYIRAHRFCVHECPSFVVFSLLRDNVYGTRCGHLVLQRELCDGTFVCSMTCITSVHLVASIAVSCVTSRSLDLRHMCKSPSLLLLFSDGRQLFWPALPACVRPMFLWLDKTLDTTPTLCPKSSHILDDTTCCGTCNHARVIT